MEDDSETGIRIAQASSDFNGFMAKGLSHYDKCIQIAMHKNLPVEAKNKLREELSEMLKIITEQQNTIAHLIGYNSRRDQISPTYADKLKGKTTSRSRSRGRATCVAAVYPIREKKSEETKKELQERIKPSKMKIGIKGVRKIRNGGLLIETETERELEVLINEIKENEMVNKDYRVEKPKKRKPHLILYNVEDVINRDNIREELVEQNEEFESIDQIEVKTSFKSKEGYNWVVAINPECYGRVINMKRINLGWKKVECKEYLRPTLCYKCGKYGHISKFCKGQEKCLNCGGEDHQRADCSKEKHCFNFNSKYATYY